MSSTLIIWHSLIHVYNLLTNFKHVNMNLIQPCHRFVPVGQFPVIEFIEQACVNRRKFFGGQVDLVKAFPGPVQQQPSSSAGDGGGVFGPGQLGEPHPLTPQAFVLAETDGEGPGL